MLCYSNGTDNTRACVQSEAECAELFHVVAEDDESELRERKEDNKEDDGQAEQVGGGAVDRYRNETQRLAEVTILEQLHARVTHT